MQAVAIDGPPIHLSFISTRPFAASIICRPNFSYIVKQLGVGNRAVNACPQPVVAWQWVPRQAKHWNS